MKIYYEQIEGEQLDLSASFAFKEGDGQVIVNNFTGTLFKGDKIYFLRGNMGFELHCACDRCAEQALIKLVHDVEVGIEPACKQAAYDTEYEITDEDGDIYVTAPDFIDLHDILRQEAILQLPLKRLCSDDCKDGVIESYSVEPNSSLEGLSSLKQILKEK